MEGNGIIMRILIIEDDLDLCEALKVQLRKENYEVDICSNGSDAAYYVLESAYDAIILDRMLPGMDGLSILHLMRQNQVQTPVILATAMDRIHDRIDGLDSGADDYIIKPYDVQELMARLRALIRRPARVEDPSLLSYSDLSFSPDRRELKCKGEVLSLSKKEAQLLSYLLKNKEKTLPRNMLLTYIWGADFDVEEGNLDNYIHFLRKRLKTLKSNVNITTVHGVGYRMETLNA